MFYCIVIKFAHIEKIYESFVSIIIDVIAKCVTEAKKNATEFWFVIILENLRPETFSAVNK